MYKTEESPSHVADMDGSDELTAKFISEDSDFVGRLAFAIHNQQRQEWCDAFVRCFDRWPNSQELQLFEISETTPGRLTAYRYLAESCLSGHGPDLIPHSATASFILTALRSAARTQSDRRLTFVTHRSSAIERVVTLLASKRQPRMARYVYAALLTGVFFMIQLRLGPIAGRYSSVIYIPAILLTSIIFDRAIGLFATALSAAFMVTLFNWHFHSGDAATALGVFVVISIFMAFVGDRMQVTFEQAGRSHKSATASLLAVHAESKAENASILARTVPALYERSSIITGGERIFRMHDYLKKLRAPRKFIDDVSVILKTAISHFRSPRGLAQSALHRRP